MAEVPAYWNKMTSTKGLAYKPKSPLGPMSLSLDSYSLLKKKKKVIIFGDTFPEIPLEINMEKSSIGQCHYQ